MTTSRDPHRGNWLALALILASLLIVGGALGAPLVPCPACKGKYFQTFGAENSSFGVMAACKRCGKGRISILRRVRWRSEPLDWYQPCDHPGHVPWETFHSPYGGGIQPSRAGRPSFPR